MYRGFREEFLEKDNLDKSKQLEIATKINYGILINIVLPPMIDHKKYLVKIDELITTFNNILTDDCKQLFKTQDELEYDYKSGKYDRKIEWISEVYRI
jgi:hypothetical protein